MRWKAGYRDPKSGVYFIRRQIRGRRWHVSTRRTTREAAEIELARFELDPEGYLAGTAGPSLSWAGAVEEYLAYSAGVRGNGRKHVSGQVRYFEYWSRFWERRGGVMPSLDRIGPGEVDAYIAWRRAGGVTGKPVGPHSVALDVAAIKGLFTWARRTKALPANPLSEYAIPKRPKRSARIKILSVEAWDRVRPHLLETWQFVGDVLLGSSMRYSSLARLRREDVDMERRLIRLPGSEIKGKEGGTVEVSERVARAALAVAARGIPDDGAQQFDHRLEIACAKAKVERVTAHMFRHTSASLAIDAGVTLPELQKRLHHASLSTTERYVHALRGAGGWRGPI